MHTGISHCERFVAHLVMAGDAAKFVDFVQIRNRLQQSGHENTFLTLAKKSQKRIAFLTKNRLCVPLVKNEIVFVFFFVTIREAKPSENKNASILEGS